MGLSIDLRERVLRAVDEGSSKTNVAKIFNVSRKVIYNWLNLRESTGRLAPKAGHQKGHSHKITDLELFRKFIEENKYRPAKAMAIEWQKTANTTISESVMGRYLKKLTILLKKPLATKKQIN